MCVCVCLISTAFLYWSPCFKDLFLISYMWIYLWMQVLTEARCSRHVGMHMTLYTVLGGRTQVISLVQQVLHHPSHACSPLLQLHNTDPYIACHRREYAWQPSASYVRWTWVRGSQYRRLLVPLAHPEHSGFWGLKRSIETSVYGVVGILERPNTWKSMIVFFLS